MISLITISQVDRFRGCVWVVQVSRGIKLGWVLPPVLIIVDCPAYRSVRKLQTRHLIYSPPIKHNDASLWNEIAIIPIILRCSMVHAGL